MTFTRRQYSTAVAAAHDALHEAEETGVVTSDEYPHTKACVQRAHEALGRRSTRRRALLVRWRGAETESMGQAAPHSLGPRMESNWSATQADAKRFDTRGEAAEYIKQWYVHAEIVEVPQ